MEHEINLVWDNNNKHTDTYNMMTDWINKINSDKIVAHIMQHEDKLILRMPDKDIELDIINSKEIGEIIIAEYTKQVLNNDNL